MLFSTVLELAGLLFPLKLIVKFQVLVLLKILTKVFTDVWLMMKVIITDPTLLSDVHMLLLLTSVRAVVSISQAWA